MCGGPRSGRAASARPRKRAAERRGARVGCAARVTRLRRPLLQRSCKASRAGCLSTPAHGTPTDGTLTCPSSPAAAASVSVATARARRLPCRLPCRAAAAFAFAAGLASSCAASSRTASLSPLHPTSGRGRGRCTLRSEHPRPPRLAPPRCSHVRRWSRRSTSPPEPPHGGPPDEQQRVRRRLPTAHMEAVLRAACSEAPIRPHAGVAHEPVAALRGHHTHPHHP